jgi:hypothetical protein
MRISNSVPSQLGGISQQDPRVRLPSQVEDSLNAIPHPVHGCIKRPGTRWLGMVDTNLKARWLFRGLNGSDRWIIGFTSVPTPQFKVYRLELGNLSGFGPGLVEETIETTPNAVAYMSGLTGPRIEGKVRGLFLGNEMVVINRTKTVALLPRTYADGGISGSSVAPGTGPSTSTPYTLIWIRTAAYQTKYSVTVDGTLGEYQTPVADATQVNVVNIAQRLKESLVQALGALAPAYDIFTDENVLFIARKREGPQPSIKATDAASGNYLSVINDTVQRFADLPSRCYNGKIVRIASSVDAQASTYYVVFRQEGGGPSGKGVWEECPAANATVAFDPTTMPVRITRSASGVWKADTSQWDERTAGDEDTCPTPSLVGRSITSVFLEKNRLCFTTQNTVVCSEVGNFYNFWRVSAMRINDNDRIDLTLNHPDLSYLHAAVPFDNTILLLGDSAQFVLTSGDILSPKTVGASFRSADPLNIAIPPFSVQSVVYALGTNRNTVREYYRDSNTANPESIDVTSHVPKLLTNILGSATAPTSNSTVLWNGTNLVVYYRWLFDGPTQKLQSAWTRWEMSSSVDGVLGETDYFLFFIRDAGGTSGTSGTQRVEYLDLADSRIAPTVYDFDTLRLDCKMSPWDARLFTLYSTTDDGGLGPYRSVLPFFENAGANVWKVYYTTGAATPSNGYIIVRSSVAATGIEYTTPAGDYETQFKFVIGHPFRYSLVPSPLFLRQESRSGPPVAITTGYTTVSKVDLTYTNTSSLSAIVTGYMVPSTTQTIEPITNEEARAIDPDTALGSYQERGPKIVGGDVSIYANGRADQVRIEFTDSSPYCCSIVGFTWEGATFQTTQRV